MLISFHYCIILIFEILKNRKRLKLTQSPPSNEPVDELDLENDLKFDPPVYRQRYAKVYELLLNEKWRNNVQKLVDFGCAEFGLFIFIKNLNIEQILFVDIDETLLQEKIGRIEPLLVDQLRRRNSPLEVSVFAGSVADPDCRLKRTDVITAIELIEHLYPDTLDAFPYNIFSYIKPKIVIITTPNADFNVMFRRQGFRHPDHKFEWTREQFEDWANNITERFPEYTVKFSGIGKGSEETEELGCCSQMAFFTRKDLIYDEYISPIHDKICCCDTNSPCQGQIIECKLLCKCLCLLCLPDFSVGICTYLSRSKTNNDKVNVISESSSKSLNSDTNLECKFYPTYNTFSNKTTETSTCINPSQNIYYKLIQKIDYPYEIDTRSEKVRLLQTFEYRIRSFSHENSRFYVKSMEHCEIPITDIMYGDIDVSVEEVRHLLSDAGKKIEKCTIQETALCEDCIISVPQEMENITSSSEVTDSYSSKSSEPNESTKFEANIDNLSDWDEVTFSPKVMQPDSTSSSSEPKKPNPDPLFDSGYLKSPSPLETNSKLPQSSPQENPELVETDHFEDAMTTPNLSSEDNRLHLKKTVAKEKIVRPSILDSLGEEIKPKYDPNRVNELDRFHNMATGKTFMNNFLKPQNDFRKGPFKDLQVAGPSSGWKKGRKFKEKKAEKEKKENFEPSPLDDAKSITNCIIHNSLNKIGIDEEIIARQPELIRDLNPQQEVVPDRDVVRERRAARAAPIEVNAEEVLAPPQVVENGDLANNNRDNEGNNFVAVIVQEQDIDEGIDLINDNLEEMVPLLEDNVNVFDNNNDMAAAQGNDVVELALPAGRIVDQAEINEIEENVDQNEVENECESEADDSVARASREVLFDANSVQDLLEDFDIPPQANQDNILEMLSLDSNVVLVGIHHVTSNGSGREQGRDAASIQTNTSAFPNWLLQILGNHIETEEAPPAPLGTHDEPHFYCQGDGLGVHPSVIAVEIDEVEDADNDTSSEESSSNNTADFAEVEPGPSDMFDMSSLPEESSVGYSLMEDTNAQTNKDAGIIEWTEHDQIESCSSYCLSNELVSGGTDHISIATRLVDEIIRTALTEVVHRRNGPNICNVRVSDNSEETILTFENTSSRCEVSTSNSDDPYAQNSNYNSYVNSDSTCTDTNLRMQPCVSEESSVERNDIEIRSDSPVCQEILSANVSEGSAYFDVKSDEC